MKSNFNTIYLLIILFLLSSKLFAQKDTIYFDKNWQIANQKNTLYYRIKPSKIKTRDTIDYKIKTNDFNYKNINDSKFKIPESSILYIDYKVANKSQFTAGLEICLDCKNDDEDRYFLGLGYGITNSYDGKYYGLPDLHLSYNWVLFFVKGGVSNRHAYALAGISVFNLMDLGFGYSQSFNSNKTPYIQGFTFGTTIRLSKNSSAYQKMKIM